MNPLPQQEPYSRHDHQDHESPGTYDLLWTAIAAVAVVLAIAFLVVNLTSCTLSSGSSGSQTVAAQPGDTLDSLLIRNVSQRKCNYTRLVEDFKAAHGGSEAITPGVMYVLPLVCEGG